MQKCALYQKGSKTQGITVLLYNQWQNITVVEIFQGGWVRGGFSKEEGGEGPHLLSHTIPELADFHPPKLATFSAC